MSQAIAGEHASNFVPGEFVIQYGLEQRRYLEMREQAYAAADPQRRGPALDAIWDGDGDNPNAQLTVFRHFDSATVERGFLGAMPETAWVIDYPIFERIHYDLVAGYNRPALWSTLDWMHADFRRRQPTQYGLFDIDRYGNY